MTRTHADRAPSPGRDPAPQRTRRRTRLMLCGHALAVLVVLSGCTTGSDPASPLADSTSTSVTTTTDFDLEMGSADQQDLFARMTSAMTRFADAVETGEVDQAQDAASEVRQTMSELAAELESDTRREAIDLRADLVECSGAYGAVGDALADADPEAFEASTPLFRACLGIATVEQP